MSSRNYHKLPKLPQGYVTLLRGYTQDTAIQLGTEHWIHKKSILNIRGCGGGGAGAGAGAGGGAGGGS